MASDGVVISVRRCRPAGCKYQPLVRIWMIHPGVSSEDKCKSCKSTCSSACNAGRGKTEAGARRSSTSFGLYPFQVDLATAAKTMLTALRCSCKCSDWGSNWDRLEEKNKTNSNSGNAKSNTLKASYISIKCGILRRDGLDDFKTIILIILYPKKLTAVLN